MKALKRRTFAGRVHVLCLGAKRLGACLALAVCCLSGCNRNDSGDVTPPRRSRRPRLPAPPPIVWHAASQQQAATAQKIVQRQLYAFRDDEYQTALDLLGPIMKSGQTPQQLRAMIEAQYPEFAQVARIKWLSTQAAPDGTISVKLRFTTRNGSVVVVSYYLGLQNNRYLITGIQPQSLNRSMGDSANSPYSENSVLEEFFRTPN